MTPFVILMVLVPIIAAVLVIINYALAPHRPIFNKQGTYECGLLARSGQTRQPFSIVFYIIAVLYVALAVEVLLVWPLAVSFVYAGPYGYWVLVVFTLVLTLGFAIELASGALAFSKNLIPYIINYVIIN